MLAGITGINSYSSYYMNPYRGLTRAQNSVPFPAEQTQNAQRSAGTTGAWTARRPANLETPVQPVPAVKSVNPDAEPVGINLPGTGVSAAGQKNAAAQAETAVPVREGADPAEMAVRMRMIPYSEDPEEEKSVSASGEEEDGEAVEGAQGAEDAQAAAEEGKCETCEKRKYQDGSDDSTVSFQTPTRIAPRQVASAVRGHEMEHVLHEQAKAKKEGRRVVSQSVTMHTAICPECGKVYISGGTTRTTTKANPERIDEEPADDDGTRKSFSVVA